MALIVETGTGSATAESYISVADASTYFTARAVTAWAALATDALREAALRKATEFMVNVYRDRWQGYRTTPTVQALDWPRVGVIIEGVSVDSDEVPEIVKRACAEFAIRAAAGDLSADLTQGVLSEGIGPLATTYNPNSPQRVRYPAVENMLAPFLKVGSNNISMRLVRT